MNLILRTKDRDSPATTVPSSCTITLATSLNPGTYHLRELVLPHTWHTVRAFHNATLHYLHGAFFEHTSAVVVPAGYYTVTELVAAVTTAMNADMATNFPGESYTWTCSYDALTGRIGIQASATSQLKVTDGTYSLHATLGFVADHSAGAGSLLTASFVPDLVGDTRTVQIVLQDGDGAHTADAQSRPATFYLVPDVNPGEEFVWRSGENAGQAWTVRRRLTKVKVQVLDSTGVRLSLQGANFCLVINGC